QGRVLSWGTGLQGELGLGESVDARRTPTWVSRGLEGVRVKTVVAGGAHALCLTLEGKVYSWGRGRDGRLGHGDYLPRWHPALVEALDGEVVSLIAAGKAHSLAVALPQATYMWGRGAHGRLATGDTRSRNIPVRVRTWPKSFRGYRVAGAALGGAHSLLLAHRPAEVTLANPWGLESTVYAWGFGYNGQLGLDEWVGEVKLPAKVAFDRRDLVLSVVAGKTYSLACTVQGALFAWGKGWSGELGLGKRMDYRVAPTKVEFPGSGRHLFVKLAGGECHALALALSDSPPAKGWDADKRWKKVLGSHVGLERWESPLLQRWRCPRRPRWDGPGPHPEPLFSCWTCSMSCVCQKCARVCHQGHHIRPCSRRLRVLCECGMQIPFPGSSQSVLLEEDGLGLRSGSGGARTGTAACKLLMPVEDEDRGEDLEEQEKNVINIQRVIRGWFGRRISKERIEERLRLVRVAVESAWFVDVLGAMERSIARFDKAGERNREGMEAADEEAAFYRYYVKLQPCLLAIAHQAEAIREFSTQEGVTLQTLASVTDPRVACGHSLPETVTLWSRRAVRQLQRQLPPRARLEEKKLVRLTKRLPGGGRATGRGRGPGTSGGGLGSVPDPDVDTLMRSSQCMRRRETAELAAPEGLYRRVTSLRARQTRALSSRRRFSFSEEDAPARVDKGRSEIDQKWASMLSSRYWIGVDGSLSATRHLQIGRKKYQKLTDKDFLSRRRGARILNKFLRGFGPGSIDPDVMAMMDQPRRQRSRSLCAPERLHAATASPPPSASDRSGL
ncbi:unnamed protein product, partial [Discosporangium mesarthrocarpum]